jgi:hypothetical protein
VQHSQGGPRGVGRNRWDAFTKQDSAIDNWVIKFRGSGRDYIRKEVAQLSNCKLEGAHGKPLTQLYYMTPAKITKIMADKVTKLKPFLLSYAPLSLESPLIGVGEELLVLLVCVAEPGTLAMLKKPKCQYHLLRVLLGAAPSVDVVSETDMAVELDTISRDSVEVAETESVDSEDREEGFESFDEMEDDAVLEALLETKEGLELPPISN